MEILQALIRSRCHPWILLFNSNRQ